MSPYACTIICNGHCMRQIESWECPNAAGLDAIKDVDCSTSTLAVGDLDASKALLGDAASKVRNAKQPGRRIMTLRNRQLDISVNVAFISDHVAGAVPPPAKL